jgi:two-component system, sensor histidine kinase LadS
VINAPADSTLADALAWPEAAWVPWTGRGYLSAKHGDVIWVRVKLTNPGSEPLNGMLTDTSYFSDRVVAYVAGATGSDRERVSGTAVAGADKPLQARMAVFPLTVPAGGERVVYLRASDAYQAHIQPVWWAQATDFFEAKTRHLVLQTVCFGALLALVFYNVVLWLRLRFTDMGYYVLMAGVGTAANFIANGGFALLGVPLGSPWHETLIAGSLGVGAAFMMKFARVFLGTAELMPRADKWLRVWVAVLAGLVVLTPGMLWMETPTGLSVVVGMAVLNDVICMTAAVVAWRRGATHARFFLAAFGFLALAGVPLILDVVRGDVGAGVAMGLLVGRTLEMLLLSFAVADRFAQTQRLLVEETEQRRAVEHAYADELEVEVRERTRELVEANADKDRMIAVIGHDLRSPLTALTRTAEQLANGATAVAAQTRFIGEAAQMGRQVLLLIEDLVLWARLRAGTTHRVVQPVAALVAPVMELYRPMAERRDVQLRMADGSMDLKAETDIVLAQTLVRNLVANALRFARTSVEVVATPVPGGVRITVRDDGPGLPPAVAARFEADVVSSDWAGHGLGLRLCMEIGRVLGAGLCTQPGEQGGTEFSFTLPAASENPEKKPQV